MRRCMFHNCSARTGSVPYSAGMPRRSRVVVSLALLGLAMLVGAGTAFAHDPIILTDAQTSPDTGPLLPDGTISFALYGTLNAAGDTRGLRVRFNSGNAVDITLFIPDRARSLRRTVLQHELRALPRTR